MHPFVHNAVESARFLSEEALAFYRALSVAPERAGIESFDLSGGEEWGIAAALLLGWYACYWLLKLLWFTIGRWAGFASIRQYYAFTWLWLPWQPIYRQALRIPRYFRQLLYGEGPKQRWAGFWEMAAHPFNPNSGAVLAGRLPFAQRFGLHMPVAIPDGGKSVAYISYAGGGKTAQLAAWLGCLPKCGAAVVFDMEGALVDAFGAALKAAGRKVVKLDPDRIAKGFAAFGHWNPFCELAYIRDHLGPRYVVEFAEKIAHALIVQDSTSQPVFANQARVFMKALILWVFLFEREKTLKRLRTLLNRGLEELAEEGEGGFERLKFEMGAVMARYADGEINDGCNGALFEAIANAQGLMDAMASGVNATPDAFRKTAIYQTQWIDDDKIHEMTAFSDTNVAELKLSNTVVFLCSTLSDMQTRLGPIMRCFLMVALYAFEKIEPKKVLKVPCLFLLDELPQCGKIEAIETALPGFRKYGARLVIATQSIGLLRATYPQKYQEFLNQSQCVVWMGISPTDKETLEFLCNTVLGSYLRKEKINGFHWVPRLLARLIGLRLPVAQYQMVPRKLLETQQAAAYLNRANGQIIVTREGGEPPFRLKRLAYWKDLSVTEYIAHDGHGETLARRIVRSLIARPDARKASTTMTPQEARAVLGVNAHHDLADIEVCYRRQNLSRLNRLHKARLDAARTMLLRITQEQTRG